MIVASGVAGAYSIKKIQNDMDEKKKLVTVFILVRI